LPVLVSEQAAEAARVLGVCFVVPVHYTGWQHFTEGGDQLRAAFDRAGLADRLVLLTSGEAAELAD
jgi:L-ascorbate metabolism protein UlaG (beta-lactamase superfamily)